MAALQRALHEGRYRTAQREPLFDELARRDPRNGIPKSTRPTFAGALHGPCVAIGVRYALLILGTAFDTDRSLCLLSKE